MQRPISQIGRNTCCSIWRKTHNASSTRCDDLECWEISSNYWYSKYAEFYSPVSFQQL